MAQYTVRYERTIAGQQPLFEELGRIFNVTIIATSAQQLVINGRATKLHTYTGLIKRLGGTNVTFTDQGFPNAMFKFTTKEV